MSKYNFIIMARGAGKRAHISCWIFRAAKHQLSFECFCAFTKKYYNNGLIKYKYIKGFLNYHGTLFDMLDEVQHEFDITGNITIFESEV